MADPSANRAGWALPVLLAVTTTSTLGFGFLYLTRPNAGELGSVRVVVADEDGKAGNVLRVVVAEAPLVQKDTVSPGRAPTGTVHYPVPYRTQPNLKLVCGKRHYDVVAETELGFTWSARVLPDDLRDDARKDPAQFDRLLGDTVELAAIKGTLKPGLVFEEFTWEAKGLRAPPSALPPKTFEQTGTFEAVSGQEAPVQFPVAYASAPNVEVGVDAARYPGGVVVSVETVVVESTPTGFRWKAVPKDPSRKTVESLSMKWKARGVLAPEPPAPKGK
jgi:hypothetical protein